MDLYRSGRCSLCKFLVDNDDLSSLDSRRDLISLIITISRRDNAASGCIYTGTVATLINRRVYCEIIARPCCSVRTCDSDILLSPTVRLIGAAGKARELETPLRRDLYFRVTRGPVNCYQPAREAG